MLAAIDGMQGTEYDEVLVLGPQLLVSQPSASQAGPSRHSTRAGTAASTSAVHDPLRKAGVHGRKPQPTEKALIGVNDPGSMALGLPDAHAVT